MGGGFMKRISAFFISVLLVFSVAFSSVSAEDKPVVSAESAVLIDAVTGRVIYAENENEKRPMASTTKIMTTLLCLESGDLDEQFTVDSEAIKVEGSSMGLCEGDVVTKRILCYGMLLPSGNDAANATAVKLAGDISSFSEMMNNRAKEIGMKNTNFITPSGLHDENHYSTAYDMAILTREALKNPDFSAICSQCEITTEYGNPPYRRTLYNTNKLLSMYEGCNGVKTGFTDEAGRCLVSVCEKDGVKLIAVTLFAPDDWNDHKKLFDYGFSKVKCYKTDKKPFEKKISVVGGEKDFVSLSSENDGKLALFDGEYKNIKKVVKTPAFLYAPVFEGEKIGEIDYYIGDELIFTENLYADENVYVNIRN